jgi:hypothetical protein
MSPPAAEAAVHPAAIELTALAVAVRPDWDGDIVAGVLQRARDEKMPWPKVLVSLPRLMADPDASPRDLLKACASPLGRTAGTEARDNPDWLEHRQRVERIRAGVKP